MKKKIASVRLRSLLRRTRDGRGASGDISFVGGAADIG
jgi:hypothetical protein